MEPIPDNGICYFYKTLDSFEAVALVEVIAV